MTKNRQKIFGFLASLFLHSLLLTSLYFIFTKNSRQPKAAPEVTLEIELISQQEADLKNKIFEKVRLKKETHEPSAHIHPPEETAAQHSSQISDPIFHPLPEIPDDLRDEAFSSKALARFHIGERGTVSKVELIQPCANPRLNILLLKSLQRWRFPIETSNKIQDISVTFSVK